VSQNGCLHSLIIFIFKSHQVIEFVEHCRAFKDYLDGGSSRYYPDDPSINACTKYLKAHQPAKKSECREASEKILSQNQAAEKAVCREAFEKILSQKSPVFRFFFVEKFGHSHQAWHASKLRYTRSVAVNSMVGHILGIGKSILHRDDICWNFLSVNTCIGFAGDRHFNNQMVHQETGEVGLLRQINDCRIIHLFCHLISFHTHVCQVIHIDFGIVFEGGKVSFIFEQSPCER